MKNLKIALVTIMLVGFFSTVSNAQALKANYTAQQKENNFSVKYTGVEDNYLCFQVEVVGLADNNSILKINDKVEGELYTQNWKSQTAYQVFKIERKDGQQIVFNLWSGNKNYTKTFSASTKMIEKTTVEENSLVVL